MPRGGVEGQEGDRSVETGSWALENVDSDGKNIREPRIFGLFFSSCNSEEACPLCGPRKLAAGAKGHLILMNNSCHLFTQ